MNINRNDISYKEILILVFLGTPMNLSEDRDDPAYNFLGIIDDFKHTFLYFCLKNLISCTRRMFRL